MNFLNFRLFSIIVLFSDLGALFVLFLKVLQVKLVLLLVYLLCLGLFSLLYFFKPILEVFIVFGFELGLLLFHFGKKRLDSFSLFIKALIFPVLFFLELLNCHQRVITVDFLTRKGRIKVLWHINLTDIELT